MDIKHGKLVSTVFHDAETVKRHEEFNIRVTNLFESYAKQIITKYRQILATEDQFGRNPIHYAAMSKYTKCFKTLEALMSIDIDSAPDYYNFLDHFFSMQVLETHDST